MHNICKKEISQLDRKKIIILEDEISIAMLIRHTVSLIGYEVIDIISSGEDAVCIIEEKQPDLLIVDICLDGNVDGIQVVEKLINRINTRIIYTSANSDTITKSRALKTNPNSYIAKPFDIISLFTEINNVFKNGS